MRIRTLLIGLNIGLAVVAVQAIAQNDWPSYGRDPGAQRYSPLTQINAGNVSTLVQAWKYETRPASSVAKSQQGVEDHAADGEQRGVLRHAVSEPGGRGT